MSDMLTRATGPESTPGRAPIRTAFTTRAVGVVIALVMGVLTIATVQGASAATPPDELPVATQPEATEPPPAPDTQATTTDAAISTAPETTSAGTTVVPASTSTPSTEMTTPTV